MDLKLLHLRYFDQTQHWFTLTQPIRYQISKIPYFVKTSKRLRLSLYTHIKSLSSKYSITCVSFLQECCYLFTYLETVDWTGFITVNFAFLMTLREKSQVHRSGKCAGQWRFPKNLSNNYHMRYELLEQKYFYHVGF